METLENNHESMKTVVETFLIEENIELLYDSDKLQQWNERVIELGLSGQTQIVKPTKSPVPFMHMKTSLVSVFETLCPARISIKEFNTTPIPLEILDLVALSEKEQYFSTIEIWYDEKNPDPACIGIIENWILHDKGTYDKAKGSPTFTSKNDAENYALINGITATPYHYSWGGDEKKYLIGKWADVRHSIEELKQMAITRFVEEQGEQLRKTLKDTQRKLDDIESDARAKFN
jgi:hypothetical protein